MLELDLYKILGVLSDAEDVVITAAYRALAQRYHPDKWTGDKNAAHDKMSQINKAYSILGDKTKRKQYDEARSSKATKEFEGDEEQTTAFDAALQELDEKWGIACSVYEDLDELRTRLAKISKSLAFSFVIILLENKNFATRKDLSEALQRSFLERYFGSSPEILMFASEIIMEGQKEAAKELNKLVDVLGSNTDPRLLINKIDAKFNITNQRVERLKREARSKEELDKVLADRESLLRLKTRVRTLGYVDDAKELAIRCGCTVKEIGGGFFSLPKIEVYRDSLKITELKNYTAFVYWVQNTLA
jgi:curved DNA-binding protein CbpA